MAVVADATAQLRRTSPTRGPAAGCVRARTSAALHQVLFVVRLLTGSGSSAAGAAVRRLDGFTVVDDVSCAVNSLLSFAFAPSEIEPSVA